MNNIIDAFKHIGSKDHVIQLSIDQSNLQDKVDTNRFLMFLMSIFLVFSLVCSGICVVAIKRNQIQTQTQLELMDAKTDLLIRCVYFQQMMIEDLQGQQEMERMESPFDLDPQDYLDLGKEPPIDKET